MAPSPDDHPPLAMALAWATTVMAIALEMAVPALLGAGLDRWLGIKVVFTALGAIAGLALGMVHLIRLSNPAQQRQRENSTSPNDDPEARKGRGKT